MHNVVYVGAGIANLYHAYRAKERAIFLEASDRIGGRIAWGTFEGCQIVKGAGVGRYHKDKLLLGLLEELKIPYTKFVKKTEYVQTSPETIKPSLKKLSKNLQKAQPHDDFRTYATKILGQERYKRFCEAVGYTDFESYDPKTAIEHYGFDDNTPDELTFFSFSWRLLISRLVAAVLKKNASFELNTRVTSIERKKHIKLETERGKTYVARSVYIGTTIGTLRNLFPTHEPYRYIHPQPFLRVYAKLNKQLPFYRFTVVSGVLQKIIPVAPEKHVYMVAYADNKNAIGLSKKNITEELHRLCNDNTIQIESMRSFYWKEGTHLYLPFRHRYKTLERLRYLAQRPMDGVFVHGEVVAINQGWTDSALLTVKT